MFSGIMKKLMKLPFLAVIVIAFSCSEGACFEETEAYLKGSFYRRPPLKLTAPDSLTLYGSDRPGQTIYKRKSGVQPALIPLNSAAETSEFVMKINGISDTLEVRYTTFPALISKECGYTFFHDIDTIIYSTHIIDSIKISKSRITNLDEENIRIYY